jgi:hypothetical protein
MKKADEETTITIRLPASLKKAIEDYALPRGTTLAGSVRRALEDFLVPPQRVFELPGLSKKFDEFLETQERKKGNEMVLLLVEDGGNRALYQGYVDFNLSTSGLVVLRARGPGGAPWFLLRKHIVGWYTGDGGSFEGEVGQELIRRGWFPVTYAPR